VTHMRECEVTGKVVTHLTRVKSRSKTGKNVSDGNSLSISVR